MDEPKTTALQAKTQIRYYEDPKEQPVQALVKTASHSEFLRTGRIDRSRPNWDIAQRRYLSYEEVADRTGRILISAGIRTHEHLNAFHQSIQFPRIIFHRTLKGTPHLGYCHVTAAKTSFAEFTDVKWSFYIANFFADIAADERVFKQINMRARRMYFALALEKDEEEHRLAINTDIRGNGILFRTHDPKAAMRNVLLLGAKHHIQRRIIASL